MGCIFCASTKPIDEIDPNRRFIRNLSAKEIIEEFNVINEDSITEKNKKNKILLSFMGMGEPYLNFDNVVNAFQKIIKTFPVNFSVTLASSGIKPELIRRLADMSFDYPVRAQLSLHAANNIKRKKIMPSTKGIKLSLEALYYFASTKKLDLKVNYALIEGINDSREDAEELAKLIEQYKDRLIVKFMVLNEFESLKAAKEDKFELFKKILAEKGIRSEKFIGDGRDIKGTCGQARRFYYKQEKK
jgi:23S rRNA (adenine2503-C2)-methyltransferase